jgi:hypothetical protein
MKMILSILFAVAFLQGCIAQPSFKREAYSWLTLEIVPRDSLGKAKGIPQWPAPWKIKSPVDTFVVYANYDSIRMISSDAPIGNLFTKVQIHASRWKPKPQYGNELFFLGTYERDSLPGMYFSFYTTKDWSSLMQIEYTSPGNVMAALFFSKDSISIRKKDIVNIDPKDEQSEPERAQIKSR